MTSIIIKADLNGILIASDTALTIENLNGSISIELDCKKYRRVRIGNRNVLSACAGDFRIPQYIWWPYLEKFPSLRDFDYAMEDGFKYLNEHNNMIEGVTRFERSIIFNIGYSAINNSLMYYIFKKDGNTAWTMKNTIIPSDSSIDIKFIPLIPNEILDAITRRYQQGILDDNKLIIAMMTEQRKYQVATNSHIGGSINFARLEQNGDCIEHSLSNVFPIS